MQKLCEDFPGPNFVSPSGMEVSPVWIGSLPRSLSRSLCRAGRREPWERVCLCPWETENKVRSHVSGIFTLGQGWLVKWVTEVKDFLQLFLPQILNLLKHKQTPSEPWKHKKLWLMICLLLAIFTKIIYNKKLQFISIISKFLMNLNALRGHVCSVHISNDLHQSRYKLE